MSLPPEIAKRLRLPVICSPLFIISNPDLTIAQCKAGVVGSFPSLNARPLSQLDEWLARITEELAAWDREHPDQPSAPFAVNQIVHTAAIELTRSHKNSICVALHPGTVKTAFTAKYLARHPAVAPSEAAENLLAVIDGLTPADTGQFFDWAGKPVPW